MSFIRSILGVAFDGTTVYLPGSRYTPYILQKITRGKSNFEIKIMEIKDIVDNIFNKEKINYFERYIRERLQRKEIPTFIGGEHVITYFILYALNNIFKKKVCSVIFDAHADMHDELLGFKLSHGTFVRRLIEDGLVHGLILVGVRVINNDEKEFIKKLETLPYFKLVTVDDVFNWGGLAINHKLKYFLGHLPCQYLHISIDVDVFDPRIAPGVCNPVVNGLTLDIFERMINEIISVFKSKSYDMSLSIDVVEANPIVDRGLKTIFLVEHLLNAICDKLKEDLR